MGAGGVASAMDVCEGPLRLEIAAEARGAASEGAATHETALITTEIAGQDEQVPDRQVCIKKSNSSSLGHMNLLGI